MLGPDAPYPLRRPGFAGEGAQPGGVQVRRNEMVRQLLSQAANLVTHLFEGSAVPARWRTGDGMLGGVATTPQNRELGLTGLLAGGVGGERRLLDDQVQESLAVRARGGGTGS